MAEIQEGKLSAQQLKDLIFEHIANKRKEVLQSPYVGDDCSVVDMGESLLSISMDPVTGATKNLGRIAVDINLNDIAASGAEPLGITVTLLCPLGTQDMDIKRVMAEIGSYCNELNVDILGGHTEVTDAVNRIVVCVSAIGKLERESYLNRQSLKPGSGIYMTKAAALEGTSILAAELEEKLKGEMSVEELQEAISCGDSLSVIKEGKLGAQCGAAYMHDVTEGGVLGALYESCHFLHMGGLVETDKIPVSTVTRKLCGILKIDPLRLISSGNMLFFVPQEKEEEFCKGFKNSPFLLTKIGTLTGGENLVEEKNGKIQVIENRPSDELYKGLKW